MSSIKNYENPCVKTKFEKTIADLETLAWIDFLMLRKVRFLRLAL